MDENLLELIVRTVDESSAKLQQIKASVQSIGETSASQTGQIAQLEVGLKNLENQAGKTSQASQNMQRSLLSMRNLYFLSFLWSNLSYYGEAVARSFIEVTYGAAQWNREMQNVQAQFGFTNKEAVGLQISLQDVGRNIGDIDQGLRMFTLRMYEAGQGTGKGAESMARFGYSAEQARKIGLSPTGEALNTIIDRIQKLGSAAERNTMAVAMFGRSAVTMMPVIEKGLETGRIQAELFESSMSKLEQTVSGRALDAFREFQRSSEAMSHHLGTVSGEALTPLANMASQGMEAFSRHLQNALPIIEDDFGMKTREQGGGIGRWLSDNIDKASQFLVKLHDMERLIPQLMDKLDKMRPSKGGWGWDWGKMEFVNRPPTPGASYQQIHDTIIDAVGSRLPRKGVPGLSSGIFSGVVGGLFSSAGVFDGAPAGPMSDVNELQNVDISFGLKLSKLVKQYSIQALTLVEVMDRLHTLLSEATTPDQVKAVNDAMSAVQSVPGGIKNPWYGMVPGTPRLIAADIPPFQPKLLPPLTPVPGDDLARVMQKTNKKGEPLTPDELATNLRKSLRKEDSEEEITRRLGLTKMHDKLFKIISQFDDWGTIVDRMTDKFGRLHEQGLLFISGLEAVRRNLFLGGNAMYDFAYHIAQGVSDALTKGFNDIYDTLQNGTFKLKNAMTNLVNALVDSIQRQMIQTVAKLLADKALSGMGGGGGPFSIMGMLTLVGGLINPGLGLAMGLLGKAGGSLFSHSWEQQANFDIASDQVGPMVGPPPPTSGGNLVQPKVAPVQISISPGAVQINGGIMDTQYVQKAVTDSLANAYNTAMREGSVRGTV